MLKQKNDLFQELAHQNPKPFLSHQHHVGQGNLLLPRGVKAMTVVPTALLVQAELVTGRRKPHNVIAGNGDEEGLMVSVLRQWIKDYIYKAVKALKLRIIFSFSIQPGGRGYTKHGRFGFGRRPVRKCLLSQ